MKIPSVKAIIEYKNEAILGKSPVWDEESNQLYWVDILSGKLFRYDPKKKINITYTRDKK